jgi:hypothetical protein
MTNELPPRPIVRPALDGHRRTFGQDDKLRIVAEALQPGANLSAVARLWDSRVHPVPLEAGARGAADICRGAATDAPAEERAP